ncbi:MAG: hypothetical protein C4296_09400 [Gemmataceae bacterium]
MSRQTTWAAIGLLIVGAGGYFACCKIADIPRQKALQKAETHLKRADDEVRSQIAKQTDAIHKFFEAKRQRVPEFVDAIYGWGSWVSIRWLFSSKESFHNWVFSNFGKTLFTEEELKQFVEGRVSAFLNEVESIESRMLVELRLDLEQIAELDFGTLSEQKFRDLYERHLHKVTQSTGGAAVEEIGRQIGTFVASEVATQIVRAMLVRMGLISGGTVSTLGIGLVAGIIVDLVWDYFADTRGELITHTENILREMENGLCEGTEVYPGLERILEQIAKRRADLRRKAIHHMLEEQFRRSGTKTGKGEGLP